MPKFRQPRSESSRVLISVCASDLSVLKQHDLHNNNNFAVVCIIIQLYGLQTS